MLRLDTNPQRCPRAREQRKVDIDLREILFGKAPNVYRAIFMIDSDTVRVLRIRRAQRRPPDAEANRRRLRPGEA